MSLKYMVVLGIRPDIINLHPLVRELQRRKCDFTVVHTGQHYSYFFDRLFFEQLNFPKPDYHLKVGSGTQAQQLALLVERFERVLLKEKPNLVFSFSDANPSLSGIVASKMGIKVAHLEAGMRSYDWRMPEEKNRRLMDSIADYLFAPTATTRKNLLDEGIPPHRIFQVGKLIWDVLYEFRHEIDRNEIMEKLSIERKDYFLVTAHRPENVGTITPLRNIMEALGEIRKKYGKRVIFPIHPRSRASIKKFKLKVPPGITLMDPLGFLEFSKLEKNAFCCITDSGTVQEDSCIFRTPCVTMRISTERSETVEVGSNIVAGLNKKHIMEAVDKMVNRKPIWKHPYGQPNSAEKIVGALEKRATEIRSPKVWWDSPRIKRSYSISSYVGRWKNPLMPDCTFD
ncbi:MAG: UDP-N-acetylglucosamine 2-epimerase (non-hydrolyzing) [Thaumarchaeota archaeon]|nr:UDP-N-acetylglucosamine 2-epimerase (non-hydrolyzing) [Nitrososphaerota archaeon]